MVLSGYIVPQRGLMRMAACHVRNSLAVMALLTMVASQPGAAQMLDQSDGQATVDGSCLAFQSSLSTNLTQAFTQLAAKCGSLAATGPGGSNITYDYLTNQLALMLGTCTKKPAVALRPIKLLAAEESALFFGQTSRIAASNSGFKVVTSYLPWLSMIYEVQIQLDNQLNTSDLWQYDARGIVDMADSPGGFGFVDLKPFIDNDDDLIQWQDFHPYFRSVASVHKGRYIGVPFVAFNTYLYYRKDIFRRYNLTVPASWDDYLSVAKKMNGTDLDGDGKPGEFSVCMASSFLTNKVHDFMLVYSPSFLQTGGTSQGFMWDPLTMQPLLNNPAMADALTMYRELLTYVKPPPKGTMMDLIPEYPDLSKCLMGISSAEMFKLSWQWPKVRGNLGIALVPGSTRVLDRTTMQLVPCRSDLCSDRAVDAQGNTISVNRAVSSGAFANSVGMNPHTAPELRPAIWRYLSAMATPSVASTLYLYNSLSPMGPMRLSELSTTPESLVKWTKLGYNIDDARTFLEATMEALNHPNRVADFSVKNTARFLDIHWSETAAYLFQGQDLQVTLNNLDQRFRALAAASGDPEIFAAGYRDSLKFQMPNKTIPTAYVVATTASGLSDQVLIPGIVAPVSFLALLALVVLAVRRQVQKAHKQHRTLLGRAIIPPPPGPLTTLLVTDVEGSTTLFEAIPQAMDAAMAVHNAIITLVADKHAGYASTSEGDGWVIAFHTPNDAASAAIAFQEALMTADWPVELLQQPSCVPTWVTVAPGGPLNSTSWAAFIKAMKQKGKPQSGMHQLLAASRQTPFATQHSRIQEVMDEDSPVTQFPYTNSLYSKHDGPNEDSVDDPFNDLMEEPAGIATAFADSQHLLISADRLRKCKQLIRAAPAGASLAQGPFLGCSLQDLWKAAFIQRKAGDLPLPCRTPRPTLLYNDLAMPSTVSLSPTSITVGMGKHLGLPAPSLSPTEAELDLEQTGDAPASQLNQQPSVTADPRSLPSRTLPVGRLRSILPWGPKRETFNTWDIKGAAPEDDILVFKGLRVRMGVHSGLQQASDVVINKTTGRHQYGGAFLAAAKSVADAAHGGMVLVSQETFQQASWSSLSTHMVVLCVGEHVLKASSDLPSITRVLYEVVPHAVALRAAIRPPQLRSVICKQPGYSVAPCGVVAVGYFQAVGIPALMSWDQDITHSSLKLMHSVATSLLTPFGGYLLDLSEALGILAGFTSTSDAIRWALLAQRVLIHAEWAAELLEHPLGEEMSSTTVLPGAASLLGNSTAHLLSLGTALSVIRDAKPVADAQPLDALTSQPDITSAGQASNVRRVKFNAENVSDAGDRPSLSTEDPGQASSVAKITSLRGLRTRCGIDVGEVRSTINELSGRITYVGKVMNRAARIAQATKSGQVWCSSAAWDATMSQAGTDGVTSRAASSVSRLNSARSKPSDTVSAYKDTASQPSDILPLPRSGTLTHDNPLAAAVLQDKQQPNAISEAPSVPRGAFGIRTEDLPVVAKTCKRSSSSVVSEACEDDSAVARAMDMAADMARISVGAISLGAQKLKSLQEMITLVKCELDQTALALFEIHHQLQG